MEDVFFVVPFILSPGESNPRWTPSPGRRRAPTTPRYSKVRVFPLPDASRVRSGPRSDFRDTIYWTPSLTTDEQGQATVRFPLSDAVTSFRATAEGLGAGRPGRAETLIVSSQPFSMAVKLPSELSSGDRLLLPVSLSNQGAVPLSVELETSLGEGLVLEEPPAALSLDARRTSSLYLPIRALDQPGPNAISLSATALGLQDSLRDEIRVAARGFPRRWSSAGSLEKEVVHSFALEDPLPGSTQLQVSFYPNPLSSLAEAIAGGLKEPSGCFEQVSSKAYPNVLIAQFMAEAGLADSALLKDARGKIHRGHERLVQYETPSGGFSMYGREPGHEALTAMGLLQLTELKQVYAGVEAARIARLRGWLLSRRDGEGGFLNDDTGGRYGGASKDIRDAYITWSLARAGAMELGAELGQQAELARSASDPYLLALASHTLCQLTSHRAQGQAAAARLAGMQGENGSWNGAASSVTSSRGLGLQVETTALGALALMAAGGHDAAAQRAVQWLLAQRRGNGTWGSTQATVLALQALVEHGRRQVARRPASRVRVLLDGQPVRTLEIPAGARRAQLVEGLGEGLSGGEHQLQLRQEGDLALPYAAGLSYRAITPESSAEAPLALRTSLSSAQADMGEMVSLLATVENRQEKPLPDTLLRLGLPAGLSPQDWQLEQLAERGEVALVETRPREVTLYLDGLAAGERREFSLELSADIPGSSTGPASCAYLYYSDEHRAWAEGLALRVEPPRDPAGP